MSRFNHRAFQDQLLPTPLTSSTPCPRSPTRHHPAMYSPSPAHPIHHSLHQFPRSPPAPRPPASFRLLARTASPPPDPPPPATTFASGFPTAAGAPPIPSTPAITEVGADELVPPASPAFGGPESEERNPCGGLDRAICNGARTNAGNEAKSAALMLAADGGGGGGGVSPLSTTAVPGRLGGGAGVAGASLVPSIPVINEVGADELVLPNSPAFGGPESKGRNPCGGLERAICNGLERAIGDGVRTKAGNEAKSAAVLAGEEAGGGFSPFSTSAAPGALSAGTLSAGASVAGGRNGIPLGVLDGAMGNCLAAKRLKGEASAISERRSSSATATIMPAMASWFGLGRWRDSGVLKRGTRPSEVVKISVEGWPRGLGFRRMGGSESGRAVPVRADWERLIFLVVFRRFGLEGTRLLEGWGVLAGGRGSWSCQ